MCLCPSCKVTDSYAKKGFAAWPRGEAVGPARSKAMYAAHVAFAKDTGADKMNPMAGSPFPCRGTVLLDPHACYSFPTWADLQFGTAHYVEAFEASNHHVTAETIAKAAKYRREVEREEKANRRNQLRRAA